MRVLPTEQTDAWRSGDYTGSRRPMQRATIQVMQMATSSYAQEVYANYIFGQANVPIELPNIQHISWDRHVDVDAATCTLTLYNTKPLPLGTAATPDDYGNYIFDQPGYYTFNRGMLSYTNRWHHEANEWQSLIAPDRIIRTYEGRGFDPTVGPEFDASMTQSGVWIIDEVVYNANGLITVTCRDAGRLLIDQILFPPVVPKGRYPLSLTSNHDVANVSVEDPSTVWTLATYDTDSSAAGHGGPDADIAGHHAHDAFTYNNTSYWLSVGYNTSTEPAAFEWIQGEMASQTVKAVEVSVRGGPYVCYVSLYTTYNPTKPSEPVARRWGGGATIPYDPSSSSTPNASDIPFVHSFVVPANSRIAMRMGDTILDCTKYRLTFRHLYNSHVGTPTWSTETYRAAVYYTRLSANFAMTPGTGTHVEGDYGDYTEIVKKLLAYGGLHWPNDDAQAFLTLTDGSHQAVMPPDDDPVIGGGRIWGDLMDTGTAGVAGTTLGPTVWDKKSVMDGIAYVRDMVGFNFFIDETGGAVFRSPNVWKVGNYVGDVASGSAYYEGADNLITIDENETLLSLDVTLTSRNVRDWVFISDTSAQVGATAKGHTGDAGPFDSRLRRVAGWTDQHFESNDECNIMADLISLRQLFSYRTDRLMIPGYSGIQIDDQVRIIEGTTSEDYVHYVRGIHSEWSIESGEWTYALDTHWLGEEPFSKWVFDPSQFAQVTQDFLAANGSL